MNDAVTLTFLGQSGFLLEGGGVRAVIDPYLSDSAGRDDPRFSRAYPVPLDPADLRADLFLVTHDHLDHLDPDTIAACRHKADTRFAAPRFAAQKLLELGIPKERIAVVNPGETAVLEGVEVRGVFALPTDPGVLDTTGYRLEFPGGKSVYHTSDTACCELLLEAAPPADVLLTCINGKFGNLTAEQAVALALAVGPRHVIPHHYDVMARNGENPESFRYFCERAGLGDRCRVLKPMERFRW